MVNKTPARKASFPGLKNCLKGQSNEKVCEIIT
jgi:hypothetical protein